MKCWLRIGRLCESLFYYLITTITVFPLLIHPPLCNDNVTLYSFNIVTNQSTSSQERVRMRGTSWRFLKWGQILLCSLLLSAQSLEWTWVLSKPWLCGGWNVTSPSKHNLNAWHLEFHITGRHSKKRWLWCLQVSTDCLLLSALSSCTVHAVWHSVAD